MSTMDNLQEAFAGESQANRKYIAFAAKADEEGYPGIARLFRAAAEAETVHAILHLQAMGKVGSTADNLRAAIEGETYEHTEMYPPFLDQAKSEGAEDAIRSFYRANAVEKLHADLYAKALKDMEGGTAGVYWVCQDCGNTVENEAPEVCPICSAPKEKFKRID